MTKYQPPLRLRDNDKDEAVRRASDPALAYNYGSSPKYEPNRTTDLLGSPVRAEDIKVPRRKGVHSPMPNEGPQDKWPQPKDYITCRPLKR